MVPAVVYLLLMIAFILALNLICAGVFSNLPAAFFTKLFDNFKIKNRTIYWILVSSITFYVIGMLVYSIMTTPINP